MKRFDYMITFLIVSLVAAFFLAASFCVEQSQGMDATYKVEINRVKSQIEKEYEKEHTFEIPDITKYQYITEVSFIPFEKNSEWVDYLHTENNSGYELYPLYNENTIAGFVKIVYRQVYTQHGYLRYFFLGGIGFIFMLIILFVLYIRTRILLPFHKIASMPLELAKGNLSTKQMEEHKGKYFGQFIWGIGMLQDKMNVARKKELQLEKEKKLLILSISHDIKTPLNAIRLYAKALQEGIYDSVSEQKKAAAQIQEKTIEIEDFVKEIVKSAKEDILNIEVVSGEFYLADLMTKVEGNFKERLQDLHMEFVIESYKNKLLRGDEDRIYEVIGNLIENACKYGDGRWMKITFAEEEYCQLIKVRNSGTPVTKQDINHLFDSFYRGSNAEGKEGAGLGLYICQQIMRKLNGEIYAEMKEDGMEFVIVIGII